MADKTIDDLTATTSLVGGDLFEIENTSNNSRKITAANVAASLNTLKGMGYEAGPPTPPIDADLATWSNQGTSTATDGIGAFILKPQVGSAVRGKVKASPGTPFNVYCRVDIRHLSTNQVGTSFGAGAGILLKDTGGDNELLLFGVYEEHNAAGGDDTKNYAAIMWRVNSSSAITANAFAKWAGTPWQWLRLHSDGTTFTGYASMDGKNWITVGTETYAAHIDGAASYGVGAWADTASIEMAAIFSYFSTTAPS